MAAYAVFAYLAAEAEGDFGSGQVAASAPTAATTGPARIGQQLAHALIAAGAPANAGAGQADEAASDFLQRLPERWDETRDLAAPGAGHRLVARRSGRDWFIGAINGDTAQRIELDLDFLPAADYRVSLWRDGEGSEGLRREQQRIDADHRTLVLDLPAGGGAVAHLVPPAPRIAAMR